MDTAEDQALEVVAEGARTGFLADEKTQENANFLAGLAREIIHAESDRDRFDAVRKIAERLEATGFGETARKIRTSLASVDEEEDDLDYDDEFDEDEDEFDDDEDEDDDEDDEE